VTDPSDIRLLDVVVLNADAVASDSSADYEPECPDASGAWVSTPTATPGAVNACP